MDGEQPRLEIIGLDTPVGSEEFGGLETVRSCWVRMVKDSFAGWGAGQWDSPGNVGIQDVHSGQLGST